MAYAKLHGLLESQVQNLINNRRRRKNTPGSPVLRSDDGAYSITSGGGDRGILPQLVSSSDLTKNLQFQSMDNQSCFTSTSPKQSQFEIVEAVEMEGAYVDGETSSLPVSNINLLQVLNKKSSYSIEKYLKSPVEAVPFWSIRRALATSHRPDLSIIIPPLPLSQLEPTHVASMDSRDSRPSSPLNVSSALHQVYSLFRARGPAFLPVPAPRSQQNSADSSGSHYSADSINGYGTPSTVGSVNNFAPSSVSYTGSFASSASGNSRIRTKKMRRQRYMSKRINLFNCSFCNEEYLTRETMIRHETQTHCLPQTFHCTLCDDKFDSVEAWENHKNKFHFQPQMTWFCMLDGKMDVEYCLFCSALAPFRRHYEEAHDLHPCPLSLKSHTFSTRYEIMRHLVEFHQMTEDEVSIIKDGLDIWSVKLNMAHNSGLWRCGYCGIIGADWDHRLIHIKNHWRDSGPRMTKKHPWSIDRANFHDINPQYMEDLRQGKRIKERPWNMHFHGFQVYEAAVRHRAKRKVGGMPFGDEMECDLEKPALIPSTNSAASFFSQLASRTKVFLSFAKIIKKEGKKEEG